MFNKQIFLTFMCLTLMSCGSSMNSSKSYNVRVGDVQIGWFDMAKSSEWHRKSFKFAPGESVYVFRRSAGTSGIVLSNGEAIAESKDCDWIETPTDIVVRNRRTSSKETLALINECTRKFNEQRKTVHQKHSFDQFVAMAEQAVKTEGSCRWLGYSRSFDLRARGPFLRASDELTFFAKLNCG